MADDYTYFCQSWEAGLCFSHDYTGFFGRVGGRLCTEFGMGKWGVGGGVEEGVGFLFWLTAVHRFQLAPWYFQTAALEALKLSADLPQQLNFRNGLMKSPCIHRPQHAPWDARAPHAPPRNARTPPPGHSTPSTWHEASGASWTTRASSRTIWASVWTTWASRTWWASSSTQILTARWTDVASVQV